MNAAATSRRAGVSKSTLTRILTDQVDPAIGTVREIAIACGIDLVLSSTPSADPLAAAAARSMLEDGYVAPATPEIQKWKERLHRLSDEYIGGDAQKAATNDPLALIQTAAVYSSPLLRHGAELFEGTATVGRLASAGFASKERWAVSGAAGLYLPDHTETAPATTILWCEDVRTVVQLLADSPLRPTHREDRATVAVIEAEPELFAGSFTEGIVRYAAPIQIILDCLSQPGQVADQALREAQTW